MRCIRPADQVRQPWKNGGGVTHEIAARHEEGRMLWRVSIASVAADGPFSDFTGYDRTIMLLSGAGMRLALDGAAPVAIDQPFRPFAFDGGARVDCTLIAGPVRDFNLMADRARARAAFEVVSLPGGGARVLPAADDVLVHLLEGAVAAGGTPLAAGDTLWLRQEPLRLAAGVPARIAIAVIGRR